MGSCSVGGHFTSGEDLEFSISLYSATIIHISVGFLCFFFFLIKEEGKTPYQ